MFALTVAWLVRLIGFVALAGLVGSLAVDRLVLPTGTRELGVPRQRLRAIGRGCIVLLLLTAGGDLWLRAGTMSGDGPALTVAAVPLVLTRTHFGPVWIARTAGLLILLPLLAATSRGLRALGMVVGVGIVLSVALTGHASNWGDVSPAVGLDSLHVLAATAWTGGLLVLAGAVLRDAGRWPSALLAATMRRFSRMAGWCLLLVVLTGLYNAWLQLAAPSALWQTGYGRVLGAKVLLVLGLTAFGAMNRYVLLPSLDVRRAVATRLVTYVTVEAALAILVFAGTAVLVESTPARHARHLEHHGAGEPARPPVADLLRLTR